MTNKKKHFMLWDKMAVKGYRSKKKAFRHAFKGKMYHPQNTCFACEEAMKRMKKEIGYIQSYICKYCPIIWKRGENSSCSDLDSPYIKWMQADTKEERQHWAGIIRDLPWISMESQSPSLTKEVSVA